MTQDEADGLDETKEWFAVGVADFDALPTVLPFPFETFVLFLAFDARGVPDEVLVQHSQRLLEAGARAVCAWGPDCERFVDACVQASMESGLDDEPAVVMTTWHEGDTVEQAVWFAANVAFAHESYAEASRALVALSVGSDEWASRIRAYLDAGTPSRDEA